MSNAPHIREANAGPMSRRDWKVLVARTLIVPLPSMQVLYREARRQGLISTGPGGVHSRPLSLRERKDFLEFVAKALCVGSFSNVGEKFWARQGRVSWREADGLVAEIRGGAITRVTIPDGYLNILLAADLS